LMNKNAASLQTPSSTPNPLGIMARMAQKGDSSVHDGQSSKNISLDSVNKVRTQIIYTFPASQDAVCCSIN
jgi:hypothetical protein